MLRGLLVIGLLSSLCRPVTACQCEVSFGVCKEVRASDLVFIGTVQSIQPLFLSRWYGADQSPMRSLNDALIAAQEHPSADSLRQAKDAYLAAFPQLDDVQKREVQSADTVKQVILQFDSSLDRGMRVHFTVKSIYKREEDDDKKDHKKDDQDDGQQPPGAFDVWTPASDCGYDFQLGETYLVYANQEEGADYYFTGRCTRTERLSQAGEDIGYLFFYKEQPNAASRVEGFATSDRKSPLSLDPMHDPATIASPISAIVIQLQSERTTRYAETNADGKFVFDGLPDGTYQLSAFAAGYPRINQLLSGPRRLLVKDKSCIRQVFVLPKPGG